MPGCILLGEEGLNAGDCGGLVAGLPLSPAVPGQGRWPWVAEHRPGRASTGHSPRGCGSPVPARKAALCRALRSCRRSQHPSDPKTRSQGKKSAPASWHLLVPPWAPAELPEAAPSPKAGVLLLRGSTRRFVPTSPRWLRSPKAQPLPAPLLRLPSDKGTPRSLFKQPWKAKPPRRLPHHPSHPHPRQPLAPQHHPSTPCPLAGPSANRFRMKEPFLPKAAPPATTLTLRQAAGARRSDAGPRAGL